MVCCMSLPRLFVLFVAHGFAGLCYYNHFIWNGRGAVALQLHLRYTTNPAARGNRAAMATMPPTAEPLSPPLSSPSPLLARASVPVPAPAIISSSLPPTGAALLLLGACKVRRAAGAGVALFESLGAQTQRDGSTSWGCTPRARGTASVGRRRECALQHMGGRGQAQVSERASA